MQDLIKTIRKKMNLSQEQLAALIGISPVTVNRWENEKAKPSLMAQKQLYDICVSHKLDLADYIVEREQIHENRSVLYHASRFGISGNIQPISRSRCDFGKGFYMGTDPIQPLTLVCNEKNPVFTKLWGKINCETKRIEISEESAFGTAAVRFVERKTKEWVITGTAKEVYNFDEDSADLKPSELKEAKQKLEIQLADVKKKHEDYVNSTTTTSALASTTVPEGKWSF